MAKYNNVGFKDKDVERIVSSRSVTTGTVSNGKSRGRFEKTTITTSGDDYASISRGHINNGRGSSVFKSVRVNPDGTGTVGKVRNQRSTGRTVSGRAARRKINRLNKRQNRM